MQSPRGINQDHYVPLSINLLVKFSCICIKHRKRIIMKLSANYHQGDKLFPQQSNYHDMR